MATSITGLTDYIPQIQPFKPDLNFYSSVLQTKQAQYDAGYSQMSGLYSSILNSPMLRDSNNQRRDQFLKAIDQDLKKVSGLDLSREENIEVAKNVFKPFYEDQNIIHDIAFTKKYYNELGKAESFRNCVDPDKCGGAYWEKGVAALHYQAEEYKNADSNAALQYNAPRYTPFVNVTKKAMEAAKAAGFNIELDHKENGYIITDKNGQLLLGDGKNGPLPQFLYGLFGQDQSVLDTFKTEAYVQRKDFAKQNAASFGSEDAAESYYLNNYISKAVPTLEKNALRAQQMSNEITVKKQILEDRVNQQGGLIPGSDEESSLSLLAALEENNQSVNDYHTNVLNEIKTAPNLQDLKALRSRADSIVANTLLQGSLNAAAYEYAMGTAKRTMQADPYALESFKTSQNIYQHKANSLFDLQVWKEQKAFEKSEGIGDYKSDNKNYNINSYLRSQGIDPNKMTPEEYQKAIDKVSAGDITKPFVAAGGAPIVSGYEENRNTYLNAIPKISAGRKEELANAIEIMKSKFSELIQRNLPDSGAKAKQIQQELTHILQGTGLSANELLNGTKEVRAAVFAKNDVSVASSFGKMIVMMNDIASLWGGDVKKSPNLSKIMQEQSSLALLGQTLKQKMDKAYAEVKTANVLGLLADEGSSADKVIKDVKSGASLEGAVGSQIISKLSPSKKEDYKKTDEIFSSMLGKGGFFIPQNEAASKYAAKKVKQDIAAFEKSILTNGEPVKDINEQQLFTKYVGEFNAMYPKLRTAIESKITAFNSPYNQENTGGAQAAQNASFWNVSSTSPTIKNVVGDRLAQAFLKGNVGVVFNGNKNNLEDIKEDPTGTLIVKNYLQQYLTHLGKGSDDLGFSLSAEIVDRMKYNDDDAEVQPGVVYKVSLNPEGAKKLLGKEYDPATDYSYNIYYNQNQDPNQMATKARPNVTDVALRVKGNSITTPVDNGSISVTNMGDHYNVSGFVKYYNPFKNAMDKKEISSRAEISANPSDLIQQNVNLLNSVTNALKPTANGPGR